MLKLQSRPSISFFAATTGARLVDLIFHLLFALYVAGALCWLLLGIVSTGGVIWDGFYAVLTQMLTHFERTSLWARLIRSILYSVRFTHPSVGLIFYYLFSLTNIVAALAMVKIRQRDWVVRALAIGMIGTAAVFNLPAHLVLDFALPAIQPLHDYYHVISGLAYALGLLFFPTGGLPPIPLPRWAPWPELGAALQAGYGLLVLAFGFSVAGITDGEPMGLVLFFGIAIPLIGITAQALRYAQATNGEERQQSKVLMLSLLLSLGAALLTGLVSLLLTLPNLQLTPANWRQLEATTFVVFPLLFITIPIMIFVTVVRYRLWDFDLIINRSLVYGTLTGAITLLYILVVGGFSLLFESGGYPLLSLLATGVIAVIFHPLRQQLQQGVNRLMYGQRDEPVQMLHQLGQQLAATVVPEEVLPTLVKAVAQALKLPYTAIALKQGDEYPIAANYGQATTALERVPLHYQHKPLGYLLVAPRSPGERLTPGDYRLLNAVTRQAGAAIHAVRLTLDLQHSRQQLVTAREEERRRLRRDLHDGLGPQLATLALKIDAARNLLKRDPAQADQLLAEYKTQTQAALADLRQIVYDLRPPPLDQLGLLSALHEHIATCNQGNKLQIELDAPPTLPPLPAAVEVAAYRIALEAITNVIHHAQATQCSVRITVDGAVNIVVCDNGIGLPESTPGGVGLLSMRERAAELGGSFTITSQPNRGTQISVHLPVPKNMYYAENDPQITQIHAE